MSNVKQNNWKSYEIAGLIIIYVILAANAILFKDSIIAVLSAFFGITYTILAGKGNPICYFFGVSGSGLYSWLSFTNSLWGNLLLYMCYYIPMQILGFFKWNKHLKEGSREIVKTGLAKKEILVLSITISILLIAGIHILYITNDNNPVIDGITTILSLAGMYLTVKRCIEQWIVWMIVNGLSAIMWISIALSGAKVYSTVVMWIVYFILSFYFYSTWKKEIG